MNGIKSLQLKRAARKKAMDGSVVSNHEYKKQKKLSVNPHYSANVIKPYVKTNAKASFTGKARLKRINEGKHEHGLY